jgi:hypothetical protein
MMNSRIKDFFDLWVLAKQSDFEGPLLLRAVVAGAAEAISINLSNTVVS